MTGNAALQAAQRAKDLLSQAAAEKLQVPAERLRFADRRVFDAENPEKSMTFVEAVWAAETKFGTLGTTGSYTPPAPPAKFKGAGVGPSPTYSFTACIAEVDVDPESGIVKVPKIYIGHDVGQCINAVTALGQIEGSVYMGLGEALMEEMSYRGNRNVVHKFPSFLEYKSPPPSKCATWSPIFSKSRMARDPSARRKPAGPSVACPAGYRERDIRRCRRAHRRSPDHSRQGIESHPGQGKRPGRPLRSHEVPRMPDAASDLCPHSVRRRGWQID